MQTYCEQEKGTPFDWNEFLERAIRGEVSKRECVVATNIAGDWVTCACGNQCSIIPRDVFGCPLDPLLDVQGKVFLTLIGLEKWEKAKETLLKIEKRSEEIIKEIGDGKEI
ncbi:hypothetical protein [Pleomorphovibrio marinus]|uniref:hypothetical protein n=1 Tax=Pleomorphovibrio marinus TaxID=2164132 RepID=UPI000E0AEAC9|nr:hypothetical protein [Pleomorphovibrio marinus]